VNLGPGSSRTAVGRHTTKPPRPATSVTSRVKFSNSWALVW